MGRTDLNDLVGVDVKRAFYDREQIFIESQEGKILRLYPYGDCCSQCSIEHVEFADCLIGKILQIENVGGMSADDGDYGVTDRWGYRLHTEKGICKIDMRLDHNGYYGGSLDLHEDDRIPDDAEELKDF